MTLVRTATDPASARLASRRELLLLQMPDEQGERPLEDLGDVAGRDLVPEQVLCLAEPVMTLLAQGELNGKALGRQRLHRGTVARNILSDDSRDVPIGLTPKPGPCSLGCASPELSSHAR